MSESELLAKLPKKSDFQAQLVLVALGPDADYPALERIADATGQQAVWVQNLADYPKIAQQVMYG